MSHIALFLPDLRVGGAERVFLTLARDFASKGHKVDLVLARAEGALLNQVPDGVHVVDLNGARWLPMLALGSIYGMALYLKRECPDVCMSTLTGTNLVAVVAHKLARSSTRLVLREACALQNIRSSFRRWMMCWLYPYADAVVSLNRLMRHELEYSIGVPSEKLYVLANPVNLEEVFQKANFSIEHPWFEEGAPPVVLGIGRLTPQKDFITLIRAFAMVRSQIDARLLILGEGKQRSELESLVKQLGLSDSVSLPGVDTNPYRWLARSRGFALSSRWEGSPNVVLEALALGVPMVVTSYDSSIMDLLEHNSAAILTPVGDFKALAEALKWQLAGRSNISPAMPPAILNASNNYLNVLLGITQRPEETHL